MTLSRLAPLAVVLSSVAWVSHAGTADASLQRLLNRYQSESNNALLSEQIGVVYTRLNDFDKAAEFFGKAIALDPNRIASRKNLATVLWFSGRKDESAAQFTALETSIPNDPVPQLYLGLNCYRNASLEKAAAHFERAGALASDNPETLPIVIETYLSTGRAAAASVLLERRIAAGDADPQTYRWLGDAYDRQAQPVRAFHAYSEAIKVDPNVADNYLALAAFSVQHGNPSYAREVLQRGLQHATGSARLLLEVGLTWAIQGNFENARQAFEDATAKDPAWAVPLMALGVTDLQTGNSEAAAECFRKAKLIAPKDYRCYFLYAVALNRSHSGEDAAIRNEASSELKQAILLDPRQVQPRVALAEMEIAAGRISDAEDELREAIRIEPNEPTALYKLALLYRRSGKTQDAERALHSFQQIKNKSQSEENQFVLIMKTVK